MIINKFELLHSTVSNTITLVPSSYTLLSNCYISNPSNMYTSSDSTTYARLYYSSSTMVKKEVKLFFDFSSIPNNATITNVTVNIKMVHVVNDSDFASGRMIYVYQGDTIIKSNSGSPGASSLVTFDLSDIITSYNELNTISIYGSASRYDELRVYGADITIAYQYNE